MKRFPTSSFCNAALAGLIAACALIAQPAPRYRFAQGFGGGMIGNGLLHGTVTGAPFSATETTKSQRTLSNGTQILNQQESNVYRDAEGRVRIDSTITRPASTSGGTPTTTQVSTIYDPVAGYIYRLNPAKMTAVQSPIPKRNSSSSSSSTSTPPKRTPPAGVTVQTQSLGTSTINGVTANGTQVTTTIAAGTFGNSAAIQNVRITWTSPELQIPVQITVSGPQTGNSSMNLTNIVQASPDESLFQVPSGYTTTQAHARGGARPAFRR
ncbi:MAG TPA: hypothetical protein VMA31_13790 [Bryobacteraceae bacterium]|nr:hypothetical protein [Bryobacteraceae bacterium]